jgi:DNA-binding NtrC family response regulator
MPVTIAPEVDNYYPFVPRHLQHAMRPDRKLLVVDDNFDYAETLAIQLGQRGCLAIPAGSVRQALDLLDDDPAIGVVVSDVRMPGVDGLDFRRVLAHRFPKLPVVFMTGMPVDKDDRVPSHVIILQKPFSIDALIAALAQLE